MFGTAPGNVRCGGVYAIDLRRMKYVAENDVFRCRCPCGSFKTVCVEDLKEGEDGACASCDSCMRSVTINYDRVRFRSIIYPHVVTCDVCVTLKISR